MYLVVFQCDSVDCRNASTLNTVLDRSEWDYVRFVDTIEEANNLTKEFADNYLSCEDGETYLQAQVFSISHEGEIEAQIEYITNIDFYPNKK
jgi:hypothetical protein